MQEEAQGAPENGDVFNEKTGDHLGSVEGNLDILDNLRIAVFKDGKLYVYSLTERYDYVPEEDENAAG